MKKNRIEISPSQEVVNYLMLFKREHGIEPEEFIIHALESSMREYYQKQAAMQERAREQLRLRNDPAGKLHEQYVYLTKVGDTSLSPELLAAMESDSPSSETLRWRIDQYLSSPSAEAYALEGALRGFGHPPDHE